MSNFFKTKKSKVERGFVQPEAFKDVTQRQAADIASRIGQPGPAFEGERVADLTPFQKNVLDVFKRSGAGTQPVPKTFKLAESEFVKQLSPVDPQNTLLFKAVREGARRNLRENLEQISDVAGGTGRAFSGARLEQEAKAAEGATINLNQILGELALEQERQRIQAARDLPAISEAIAGFPARQAQTALALTDVERGLEQARLEAGFQEFIRRFVETPQNISNLANQFIGIGQPRFTETVTPGQPSPFSKTLNFIGDTAADIIKSVATGKPTSTTKETTQKREGIKTPKTQTL